MKTARKKMNGPFHRSPVTRSHMIDKKRAKKSGLPPGTLVHIGAKASEKVTVSVMEYSAAEVHEREVSKLEELRAYVHATDTAWINVAGLHDTDVIATIGSLFNVNQLFLEDVVNTAHRPKIEDADDYLFIILKALHLDETQDLIVSEQLSLVVGPNFLLSFQEKEGRLFDQLKERIRAGKGRIRKSGTDYLAYCIMDSVVDNYFVLLEQLADKVEVLEENLVTDAKPEVLHEIHKLKTDMIFLRRSVWPLREVINMLAAGESPLVKESTLPYFRDVYDHTIHAVDTMETYRDIVSGMLDIYLSSVSNRLNEIMKTLTIISTIFIPLTFLAGWYGMNFKDMPELPWRWGYPMVIAIAVCVAVTMVVFIKRRKWL
jgi:magnesium transporter